MKLVTVRLQIVEQHNSWTKCNFNFCFALNSSFISHSTYNSFSFYFFLCTFFSLSSFCAPFLCSFPFSSYFWGERKKQKWRTGETRCSKTFTCSNNSISCPESIFIRKSFPFQDHNVVYFVLVELSWLELSLVWKSVFEMLPRFSPSFVLFHNKAMENETESNILLVLFCIAILWLIFVYILFNPVSSTRNRNRNSIHQE